jgi:hypothetical protein
MAIIHLEILSFQFPRMTLRLFSQSRQPLAARPVYAVFQYVFRWYDLNCVNIGSSLVHLTPKQACLLILTTKFVPQQRSTKSFSIWIYKINRLVNIYFLYFLLGLNCCQFCGFDWFRHSQEIVSILSDISHPREGRVATLFNNLQIADLDTRSRKVWDFELDCNRRSLFRIIWRSSASYRLIKNTILNTWQTKMCSHRIFFSTSKLLDFPNNGWFFRCIVCIADRALSIRIVKDSLNNKIP